PRSAARHCPEGDVPMPAAPRRGPYRQSIEYEMTQNRAIVDLASRYKEVFLFNIWRMGMNSIERGGRDSWTVTPKRIAAMEAAAAANPQAASAAAGGGRGGRGGPGGVAGGPPTGGGGTAVRARGAASGAGAGRGTAPVS